MNRKSGEALHGAMTFGSGGHLTLVAAEAIVVRLTLGSLCPLSASRLLLAAPVATGALRTAIAHGLTAIRSRRLCTRAGEVAGLASVLTYNIRD